MQLTARRYDNGDVATIEIEQGRIRRVSAAAMPVGEKVCWIAPGFVDVQVNGYDGQEFSSQTLTAEKVAAIVRRHYAFGVTGICPTLTTNSIAALSHGMQSIAAACRQDAEIGRRVLGVHLEGPYMSTE